MSSPLLATNTKPFASRREAALREEERGHSRAAFHRAAGERHRGARRDDDRAPPCARPLTRPPLYTRAPRLPPRPHPAPALFSANPGGVVQESSVIEWGVPGPASSTLKLGLSVTPVSSGPLTMTGSLPVQFPVCGDGHWHHIALTVGTCFTPTMFGGLALWLDSNDRSTITASDGFVTQWSDKSGNGMNALANPATAPTFSPATPGIVFNGIEGQFFNLPNGALPFGNSAYSYYLVVQFANLNCCQAIISGGAYGNCFQYMSVSYNNNGNGQIDHFCKYPKQNAPNPPANSP